MNALANHAVVLPEGSTLAGTAPDVRKRLERVSNERVVAVILPHISQASADAIARTFENIAQLVPSLLESQQQQAIKAVVEALMPKIMPPPNVLKEAEMQARARAAVLQSGDWMTASQIANAAGFSASNPSAQPSKWKRDKAIFTISHNGVDYFPGYGLDPSAGYRPFKALAKVIDMFGDRKDGWGLAYWFMSPNSFLGGARPQDLLRTAPQRVADAAMDELEGVTHG